MAGDNDPKTQVEAAATLAGVLTWILLLVLPWLHPMSAVSAIGWNTTLFGVTTLAAVAAARRL